MSAGRRENEMQELSKAEAKKILREAQKNGTAKKTEAFGRKIYDIIK